ncbi:MAG: hypothetical protein ACJ76X_10985 [Solirubrobacteraceae bacterium]
MATDETFVDHFEVALALHDSPRDIFGRARTQLCFGERLRRSHRRVDARGHLASAQAAFPSWTPPRGPPGQRVSSTPRR